MARAQPARTAPAGGGPGAAPKPRPVREPLLDGHDIQGNILAGFNKDHQVLLALKMNDIPAARRWLRRVAPEISSMTEVHQFNTLFRQLRARRGRDPEGLVATWANIAFSHNGLEALTSPVDVEAIPDEDNAFRAGLGARAASLGDPLAPGEKTDPTKHWVVGGTGRVPDIFLIVAGDDPAWLASAVGRLRPGLGDGAGAPEVIWEERGATLPGPLAGHEHFGFKDGVSQPGVRGLVSRRPNVYLTPRLLGPSGPDEIDFARPGQPLIWPGQFVLGYPSQNKATGKRLPAPRLKRTWFKNGSFLVFRRLGQDVAAFAAFVQAKAAELANTPAFSGMTPQRLGALLVGRWASGAPVARAPAADIPALAADGLANNDFLFTTDTPPPRFPPGCAAAAGSFPAAKEDALGLVCPHAAHIRKMNPRDQDSNLGDQFDTLTRRVLRRGIPFGPPLADPLAGDDGAERGLHFLCYQASIASQFEILQQNWANDDKVPQPGGHDLIIGQPQKSNDNPAAERRIALLDPAGGTPQPLAAPGRWVVPTGGGYFFAPSISALRDVLSRVDGVA